MTKKNFSNAFEPQILCDVCSEAVTNPICPSCLATEIQAWLTLYPNLRNELLPRLASYLNEIESRIATDATACIKCNNTRASVCPYCFTNHVLKELKKMDANKRILREFLEFFNFDFDHTGYSTEAEELGII